MKYKYLLLLLLMLPFVSGCNDSDDVNGIFTGKVWKLTYITKKNEHKPYDFWGDKTNMNNPSRITSIKKVHTQSNSKGRLQTMSSAESLAERFCHILIPEPGVPMAKAMLSQLP